MALDLPYNARGEVLPTELDQQFLDALDQTLARQETRQIQRIGESQEGRGFLQSGNTLKQVSEQVIGPGLERRQQALLPLAMRGAEMGREERLQGVQFDRQKQLQFEAAQQRLTEIDRQAQIQRELMSLQDELQGGGLGQLLGGLAGIGIGSFLGGMGGGLGQRAGASLFGGGGGGGGGTGGGMGRLDLRNSNRFPFFGD